MTAPIRILAVIGLTLAVAPAAHAATGTMYDAGTKTLTLTNDGDAERFAVTISYDSVEPVTGYVFKVDAETAAIPLGGSTCTNPGGDTTVILCEADDNVNKVIVNGGAGNDAASIAGATFYSSSGSPGLEVNGGTDDDTFTTGPGGALRAGQINGGPGNDTFIGSDPNADSFRAEPGNDTYRGGSAPVPAGVDADGYQRVTVSDTWAPSGDTPINLSLDGTANDADGLGGTDNVVDVESIEATAGNDTLVAGSGGVSFSGGGGDDALTGSPQSDLLGGDAGSDTLRGLGGEDTVFDGDFDEASRLNSEPPPPPAGNDIIDGGDGDDVISWGAGKDDIAGGAGTDLVTTSRLITQTFATEVPDGFVTKAQALTISLNDQPDDGPTGGSEGDNVHADVEDVTVNDPASMWLAFRSTRAASSGALPAGHTITGSAAANVITTGAGNDTIDPGAGADTVSSGAGDDTINAVDQATDAIQCGRGADTAGADLPGTNPGRADTLSECETVTGTPLGLEGGTLPVPPTPPKVTLGGTSTYKVKKFLRSYTVTNTVTSDQAAAVSGELTLTGAKIAKVGALSIGSGKLKSGTGTRKLKVKVAVKYRKALKRKLRSKKQRRKGIKLGLVVTAANASGQVTETRRTIRVRG